jgi:hypothetical protein
MSNKNIAGKWGIEARAFQIPYTPFTHNFWVLVDLNGNVVDQIHGLAVDPKTGTAKALGNSSHLLQVVNDAKIIWALYPGQPAVVCASGAEAAIRQRWQSAVNAFPAINSLHLKYPNVWQHTYKANSNTVFNTVGQIMSFAAPALLLPTRSPGINLVISKDIIEQYYYVHTPPSF